MSKSTNFSGQPILKSTTNVFSQRANQENKQINATGENVPCLKNNAAYEASKEHDLPEENPSESPKYEQGVLYYGEKKKEEHPTKRIAYWDNENQRLFEFISNNFELTVEKTALIYKQRW